MSEYVLTLDRKRRFTVPSRLLAEAEIGEEEVRMVAHADGRGRLVVETRAAIIDRIRQRARQGRDTTNKRESAADTLLSDRAQDVSLS